MFIVQQLARFVHRARYEDLTAAAREQLKIRVLDSCACALGALGAPLVDHLRRHTQELGPDGPATLIGGGRSAPDRAAFFNGALVRYLDFNDSFLAPGETCHPSDNLAAVLAAAEYKGASGRDLLTALAVAYQIQARLSEEAPVRSRGFDHTTQGAYAVAAGAAKALDLDPMRIAHALAISGTCQNPLRVTRTGSLSHWKGLAYPHTGFVGLHAALLAMHGVTGPEEVFEGNKGLMDTVTGRFAIDWEREDLERVRMTSVKLYNAEFHAQSTIEAVLALRAAHGIDPAQVERVRVETFDVAYQIIGGGEEGDKKRVRTKEEADHSLPYMVAAALLDGELGPAQYRPGRIQAEDVQRLLQRVEVRPSETFSRRFPLQMPCQVTIVLRDGQELTREQSDYAGFFTRPIGWDGIVAKFGRLARPVLDAWAGEKLIQVVRELEHRSTRELTQLLGEARPRPAA